MRGGKHRDGLGVELGGQLDAGDLEPLRVAARGDVDAFRDGERHGRCVSLGQLPRRTGNLAHLSSSAWSLAAT